MTTLVVMLSPQLRMPTWQLRAPRLAMHSMLHRKLRRATKPSVRNPLAARLRAPPTRTDTWEKENEMRKLIIAGAVAAAIAACASAPQRSEQVEQARTEVQTLSQEPLAQQAAGKDLDAARKALQDAEDALRE